MPGAQIIIKFRGWPVRFIGLDTECPKAICPDEHPTLFRNEAEAYGACSQCLLKPADVELAVK
jgi:hypothetical protein